MSQKSNALASQVVVENERKLATVMLADIVGYTALTQRDESLALKPLIKHKELVRAVLAKHRGKEIKTMGDSFLVEFESALEATNCAVNLQQVLHEYNHDAKKRYSSE
jgi:adenylate cyclase